MSETEKACVECGTGPKGLIHMGQILGKDVYSCVQHIVKIAGIVDSFIREEDHAAERKYEMVYCPTCRDTHAEGAPHFANRRG